MTELLKRLGAPLCDRCNKPIDRILALLCHDCWLTMHGRVITPLKSWQITKKLKELAPHLRIEHQKNHRVLISGESLSRYDANAFLEWMEYGNPRDLTIWRKDVIDTKMRRITNWPNQ